ncbi:MAG: hypothetical protein EAZ70_10300 [Runella slithyformis]|nr:MAG: hypothetical protein EAY79_11095 [Runella slithyformis]TAF25320.1 MAG: hypothetical protein EAZ70_10300 [Runella slithyformis]TAF43664.1 MAG: hypothetical protein EAZ63_13490 [Runella slithyformis]TAF78996.1 MAG: hypothetical protein EAZ50_12500 [Runella slithyformis]
MKTDNYYYFKCALAYTAGYFIIFLLLGDFFPWVKSLFLPDTNSLLVFWQNLAQVNWLKVSVKVLIVSLLMTFLKYRSNRKLQKL